MRKSKASAAPSPTSHDFRWATAGGSRAGSASGPPGWGSLPYPTSTPSQGLTGLGLHQPWDQSCEKIELTGGRPESTHPAPSVLAPTSRLWGCSPGGRRKWPAQRTPGQGVAGAPGSRRWGPLPEFRAPWGGAQGPELPSPCLPEAHPDPHSPRSEPR